MTDSRDEHEPYGHTESPIITRLQEQIARLTAERDEARCDACQLWADAQFDGVGAVPADYAKRRGWDYLRWPDPDALDRLAKLDEECGL